MIPSFVLAGSLLVQTPAESFQKAKEALDQGQASKALELLAPLAPESPDAATPDTLAPVYLLRGVAELTLGNESTAGAALESALALDPKLGPARFNLGRLRLRQSRFLEAEEQFRELIALAPKDASAHHL
ncbi:MAG: tetratricopeptide repeat protein, partial [Vicinamibacteria bacterium]